MSNIVKWATVAYSYEVGKKALLDFTSDTKEEQLQKTLENLRARKLEASRKMVRAILKEPDSVERAYMRSEYKAFSSTKPKIENDIIEYGDVFMRIIKLDVTKD